MQLGRYSEAIDVLYSQNTFQAPLHASLYFFLTDLPPPRRCVIRALQISVCQIHVPPEDREPEEYDMWHHMWEAIKSLPALRNLEFYRQPRYGNVPPKWHRMDDCRLMDLETVAAANKALEMFLVSFENYSFEPTLRVQRLSPSDNHVIAACRCSRKG
jgi:hypothetical protein